MNKAEIMNIVESWKSMKLWIKVWLFYLNAIFIFSIFFIGTHESITWILLTYISSGPYLMVFIIPSNGLSRVLGLAHIVPWTPLCLYLILLMFYPDKLYLDTDEQITSSPLFAYLIVLLVSVLACLSFDYYDVYRWFKGERYILGSKEAADKGASQHNQYRSIKD